MPMLFTPATHQNYTQQQPSTVSTPSTTTTTQYGNISNTQQQHNHNKKQSTTVDYNKKFKTSNVFNYNQNITSDPYILTTGCSSIDKLLNGGIYSSNGIYELVGEAGVGKTQLAMQLCLNVQLPAIYGGLEGCAVWINTESDIRTDRFNELANYALQRYSNTVEDNYNFLDNFYLHQVHTVDELENSIFIKIHNLIQKAIQAGKDNVLQVKLIVIDSIASVFRTDRHDDIYNSNINSNNTQNNKNKQSTTTKNYAERYFSLTNKLKQYSTEYGICIVVLNQATDVFIDNNNNTYNTYISYQRTQSVHSSNKLITSAGGLSWSSCVNTRIFMTKSQQHIDSNISDHGDTLKRIMYITLSNYCQCNQLQYVVTRQGVYSIDSKLKTDQDIDNNNVLIYTNNIDDQLPVALMAKQEEAKQEQHNTSNATSNIHSSNTQQSTTSTRMPLLEIGSVDNNINCNTQQSTTVSTLPTKRNTDMSNAINTDNTVHKKNKIVL